MGWLEEAEPELHRQKESETKRGGMQRVRCGGERQNREKKNETKGKESQMVVVAEKSAFDGGGGQEKFKSKRQGERERVRRERERERE